MARKKFLANRNDIVVDKLSIIILPKNNHCMAVTSLQPECRYLPNRYSPGGLYSDSAVSSESTPILGHQAIVTMRRFKPLFQISPNCPRLQYVAQIFGKQVLSTVSCNSERRKWSQGTDLMKDGRPERFGEERSGAESANLATR